MCEIFQKVEAIKGFLNFKLSNAFLESLVDKSLKNQDTFAKVNKEDNPNSEKILLEYVSANPTGPLHIGHARGAINGDAIARVGRHLGYDIITEYYVNDAGAQMDLLGLSVCLCARDMIFKEDVAYPETYYRGDYLIDIAKSVIEKFGKDVIYDENRYKEIAFFAKDLVLDIIIKDLGDLGVHFDNFVSEKSLYDKWNDIKTVLEDNGHLYTKDEKVYIKSTDFGDDSDRVVVRDTYLFSRRYYLP